MKKLMTALLLAVACTAGAQTNIVGYEYWFDADHASRIPITLASPGAFVQDLDDIQVPPGLGYGQHRIYYRLKDANNRWSHVIGRTFTVEPEGPVEVVALRYWSEQVLNNPSDLIEVPIPDPAQYIDILMNLDFCTYNNTGIRNVFFQLKDSRSQWSRVITRNIDVDVVGQAPGVPVVTGPDQVFADSIYSYTATVSGASWYEWTLPPGWTGSSTTGTIVVTAPDQVESGEISVVAHNACGVGTPGSFTFTVLSVGMDGPDRGTGVSLFPNPTTGSFTLQLPAYVQAHELAVRDATGRLVLSQPVANTSGPVIVDLSGHESGLYLVHVLFMDGTRAVERIVKE